MNVKNSNGVNRSYGVNWSDGVNGSNGVNRSYGVNWSNGVNGSYGVNWSNGVNGSYGVNWSDGVNRSNGVNRSYGVNWSDGIDNEIFPAKKERVAKIFNKVVSQDRKDEVFAKINELSKHWVPQSNNAFVLYDANGKEWSKVNADEIKGNDDLDWAGMPQELYDYIVSLPEFDREIFDWCTLGHLKDREKKDCSGRIVEIDGKKYQLKPLEGK